MTVRLHASLTRTPGGSLTNPSQWWPPTPPTEEEATHLPTGRSRPCSTVGRMSHARDLSSTIGYRRPLQPPGTRLRDVPVLGRSPYPSRLGSTVASLAQILNVVDNSHKRQADKDDTCHHRTPNNQEHDTWRHRHCHMHVRTNVLVCYRHHLPPETAAAEDTPVDIMARLQGTTAGRSPSGAVGVGAGSSILP